MADENIEVPDREKALVKSYAGKIAAAYRLHEKRFRSYEAARKLYSGECDGKLVRTNLIMSTIAALIPQIYAKSPDISVSPGEAVSEDQYAVVKKFGKTVEVVLNKKLVREPNLKGRCKSLLRAGMTCQVGWLKATYQKDVREDPIIRNRYNDIQENIERMKALKIAATKLDGEAEELTLAELEAQKAALQGKLEMTVAEGIVLDKLHTEDVVILDPSVRDFDDYRNAGAIAQRIPMSCEEFKMRFKRKPTRQAKTWYGDSNAAVRAYGDPSGRTGKDGEEEFVKVFEIWCKDKNTIYTWCEGEEGWCREPYQPTGLGKRWYSFFALCLNPVDGQFYGVSDIDLLKGLQEEYTRVREDYEKTRKHSLPIRVIRAGGSLTKEDIENLRAAKPGDVVVVAGDAANPITNDVQNLISPQIDPQLFDVQPIMRDIELVSGAQDAARGSIQSAKTATEAEIMQQGMVGRTAERQDVIEDLIEDLAQYTTEILLHELTAEQVMAMAGTEAVWPQAGTPDEVTNLLNIEIRAGSTGKPDKGREREQWVQMLPQIQEAMGRVQELRASGQFDMADAVVELVRETFRRFDERIDVDSFLPRAKEGQTDPVQMGMQLQQAQQQAEEMQQVMAEMQQQLQALEQEKQQAFTNREIEDSRTQQELGMQERVETAKVTGAQYEQRMAEMQGQLAQLNGQLEQLTKDLQAKNAEVFELQQAVVAAQAEAADKLASYQPPAPPEMPPINVTIPVTIDGAKGTIKKTATGKIGKDGTITMTGTEEG